VKKQAFLLIGDPFLLEEKEKELLAQIAAKHPGDIFRQSLSLEDNSLGSILTQARTFPFLAGSQFLRIGDIDRLRDDDVDMLDAYLKNPPPATYLVFETENADLKNSIAACLRKYGEVVSLTGKDRKAMGSRFIREKLKHSGKTMAPAVLRRLEEIIAAAPVFFDTVLDPLVTYACERTEITGEMLDLFEEKFSSADGFDLAGAIASRRTADALRLARELLDNNARDFPDLVGILHWQLRRMWQACVLLEEGESESFVLKKCRITHKQPGIFIKQVKGLERTKIESSIEGLFRLDWDFKTGQADGIAAIESWIIQATA